MPIITTNAIGFHFFDVDKYVVWTTIFCAITELCLSVPFIAFLSKLTMIAWPIWKKDFDEKYSIPYNHE